MESVFLFNSGGNSSSRIFCKHSITIRTRLYKARSIAIYKLAVMIDVEQATLDNIVSVLIKNPRMKKLYKITLSFNMTLAEFLNFDELNDYSFDDDSDDE